MNVVEIIEPGRRLKDCFRCRRRPDLFVITAPDRNRTYRVTCPGCDLSTLEYFEKSMAIVKWGWTEASTVDEVREDFRRETENMRQMVMAAHPSQFREDVRKEIVDCVPPMIRAYLDEQFQDVLKALLPAMKTQLEAVKGTVTKEQEERLEKKFSAEIKKHLEEAEKSLHSLLEEKTSYIHQLVKGISEMVSKRKR